MPVVSLTNTHIQSHGFSRLTETEMSKHVLDMTINIHIYFYLAFQGQGTCLSSSRKIPPGSHVRIVKYIP